MSFPYATAESGSTNAGRRSLLHEVGRGLLSSLYCDYVNKSIESRNRTTVLSFESMITKASAGVGLVFIGIVADSFDILFLWSFSALVLLISIIWFYGSSKKNNSSL